MSLIIKKHIPHQVQVIINKKFKAVEYNPNVAQAILLVSPSWKGLTKSEIGIPDQDAMNLLSARVGEQKVPINSAILHKHDNFSKTKSEWQAVCLLQATMINR